MNTTELIDKMNNNSTSKQNLTDLPLDMQFNEGHLVSIITYSIVMVISAIGNLTVLVLITRRRRIAKTRLNTMLLHLAIADLMVTFLMMPLEIGWAYTVTWNAGDAMCRIMAFFRVFGLYLSSFILICISVDRYCAVAKPLQMINASKTNTLLIGAWMAAAICSAPQIKIFHVLNHPKYEWFQQCITVGSYPSYKHELAYSLFVMVMMYWIPIILIISSYSGIIYELVNRARSLNVDGIRRSSFGYLRRAISRTMIMTIVIIVVFLVCWTPYYVMSLWYWFDRDSASKVDPKIQRGLFLFACTNSCMNPIVYGIFNIRRRQEGVVHRNNATERVELAIDMPVTGPSRQETVPLNQSENAINQNTNEQVILNDLEVDVHHIERSENAHDTTAL